MIGLTPSARYSRLGTAKTPCRSHCFCVPGLDACDCTEGTRVDSIFLAINGAADDNCTECDTNLNGTFELERDGFCGANVGECGWITVGGVSAPTFFNCGAFDWQLCISLARSSVGSATPLWRMEMIQYQIPQPGLIIPIAEWTIDDASFTDPYDCSPSNLPPQSLLTPNWTYTNLAPGDFRRVCDVDNLEFSFS